MPPPCRAHELPGLGEQAGGPFEQREDGVLDALCVHLPLGGSDFLGLGGSSPRASGPPSLRLTHTTLEGGLERRGPGQSEGGSALCTAPCTLCQRMISEPLAYLRLCWTPRLLVRQADPRSRGGSPQVLLQVLAAGDRGWGGLEGCGGLGVRELGCGQLCPVGTPSITVLAKEPFLPGLGWARAGPCGPHQE